MIIKQTSIELTVENGKPIKFVCRGIERPIEQAVDLYDLKRNHYIAGMIYGGPFTDLNTIAAAYDLEKSDRKKFKITDIIDGPEIESIKGRIY